MNIKVDSNTVVVFDLDDTLYNELDFLISAYKEIATYIDRKKTEKIFSVMFSLYRNDQNVFEYLSDVYPVKKEALLGIYRNHIPLIKLNSSTYNLLNEIHSNCGKLAILTDGRSLTQRNKLEALGIENIFDYVSVSEEIKAVKPSLKGFQLIEDKFKRSNYYYIGDNLNKDFIAPNKLGWKSICLIDNGKNIHHQSQLNLGKEKEPKEYIYSLSEIRII